MMSVTLLLCAAALLGMWWLGVYGLILFGQITLPLHRYFSVRAGGPSWGVDEQFSRKMTGLGAILAACVAIPGATIIFLLGP